MKKNPTLLELLSKAKSFKREHSKRAFQRKYFGTADGDVISLNSFIELMIRIRSMSKDDERRTSWQAMQPVYLHNNKWLPFAELAFVGDTTASWKPSKSKRK